MIQEVVDVGTSGDASVDYPDYGETPFAAGRHLPRIEKIAAIEREVGMRSEKGALR